MSPSLLQLKEEEGGKKHEIVKKGRKRENHMPISNSQNYCVSLLFLFVFSDGIDLLLKIKYVGL